MAVAFPAALRDPLAEVLRGLGDPTAVRSARPVGGGCINNAMRLETSRGVYLLKWNADALPGMFACEACGLELLAQTQTVRVPAVYHHVEAEEGCPAFILLEWLEGTRGDMTLLGEQLAKLHRQGTAPAYGLNHDNYIGSTPQANSWVEDWVEFFAARRLLPQMELAARTGNLTTSRRALMERLISRLPILMGGVSRQPALIHGDLWGGNVIPGPGGPALIDPAVSYSDREAEIAFTELFGGFSAGFYAAYNAAWPLDPGYPERRDLYNLYHLLNHLNLFGESYAYQVDSVLRRYAG